MLPAKATSTGPVLSILMVIGVASVVRPAPLVHEPVTMVEGVSALKVCADVQVTPLMSSAPLVAILTVVVYQPFAPIVPQVTDKAAVGGVLSILMVIGVASVVRPAPLVHEPVTMVEAVSVLKVCTAVQLTPLMSSAPLVVTSTLLVYQPLSLNVPDVTDNAAVGAVVSILNAALVAFCTRPA